MEKHPFDHLPSTKEIGDYFWENICNNPQDADGFKLWRDTETDDYCYLWRTMTYDMDIDLAFLIQVCTNIGGEEVRRMVFLSNAKKMVVEELPLTVKFFAENEAHKAYAMYYLDYFQRRVAQEFWT